MTKGRTRWGKKEELLEIVDTYLAEQSRRWDFIEEKGDGMYVYAENGDRYLDFLDL